MGFNLDNYEQVKDRITRFYKDHPDGRIVTELVSEPAKLSTEAAFRASVFLAETLKATGYAFEAQGQGVNRDAWVENAETSAIGRALANMDYCGTLRPSREEMSKVGNGGPIVHEKIEPEVSDAEASLREWVKATLAEMYPDEIERETAKRKLWIESSKDTALMARRLEALQLERAEKTREPKQEEIF